MPDSGDKDGDGNEVPAASSTADTLLKGVAAAPERTLPSPRAAVGGDAERFSHFTVLGRLGEGGMGIVYRARDEKLGRVVALKVLPPEFEADETKRQRFLREASVAAAVTHPNLTTVYEIGESQGRVFIAMELVEGRPLRELLGGRSLPVATVLGLMSQVAAGVAKAHAVGIVHRDLKPENILVGDDGHVKVLDFGLAKRPDGDGLLVTGTGEGMLLGTPAYMPPEQAHGQPVTAASDVFSLGVLLEVFVTDLERAVALDPHFAAAHVRLTLNGSNGFEKAGRHIAAATQGRTSLDARDQRFLAFAELMYRDPTAVEVHVRAAHELAEALPDDPEALYWSSRWMRGDAPEAERRDVLDRAIRLDPKFAEVEDELGWGALWFGHDDGAGALAATDRCLAVAPNAASCVRLRAEVHGSRGRCQDLERDARQMIGIEPDGPAGYGALWTALAANGAPVEALQEAANKEQSAVHDADTARAIALQNAANLAAWTGDFASADVSLVALQGQESSLADEGKHSAEWQRIYVYDEEGQGAKSADVGEHFLQRLPAWAHDATYGRPAAIAALSRAGRLSDAQAHGLREAFRQEFSAELGGLAGVLWILTYAWVQTPSEARDALAALPAYVPLHPNGDPWQSGIEGRVRALAGEADQAIPLLRVALARCGETPMAGRLVAPIDWIMEKNHSRLLLGQMLEQKSDHDGACTQYAAILSRWGNAKPKSVTADKARARSKALACP